MRQQQARPQLELALRNQALHDVEAVAVEHVQERRGDQVERAAHPRIHVRERHRQQREHQRGHRHRNPPEQLGALHPAIGDHQRGRRNGFRRRRQLADLVGLDAPAEPLELDDAVVRRARCALVAAAVLEDDEAVAVGHVLELAARGDCGRVLLVLDRVQEHVLHGAVQRIDALDEYDEVGAGKLAEQARGDERDVVARLELPLEFDLAQFRPR